VTVSQASPPSDGCTVRSLKLLRQHRFAAKPWCKDRPIWKAEEWGQFDLLQMWFVTQL